MSEGTVSEVLSGAAAWTVLTGDSLLALRELPDGCVDLLVTDPPYSSGGTFRGDRARPTGEKYVLSYGNHDNADFEGDTRDQRSYELWTSLWCAEAWRVAKDGTVGVLFTDWRQLGATADAFQAGGWVLRGIAAWDKGACRPRNGGMRQQCEFMVWGSRGALVESDVYLDGYHRFSVAKDKLHQAVKPDALLAELVKLCPGGGPRARPIPGLREHRASRRSSRPTVRWDRDLADVGGAFEGATAGRAGRVDARGQERGTSAAFRRSNMKGAA